MYIFVLDVVKYYTMPSISKKIKHTELPTEVPVLAEPAVQYKAGDKEIILRIASSKPESKMTAIEKMDMVRAGISKKDLEGLKETTGLDYEVLSAALAVTRATLINKKGIEKFNAALSERILSLAEIYSYGYEVFEDNSRFNNWMFSPNRALGGLAPYEILDNQYGREEIKNIIGRIDYGVYS